MQVNVKDPSFKDQCPVLGASGRIRGFGQERPEAGLSGQRTSQKRVRRKASRKRWANAESDADEQGSEQRRLRGHGGRSEEGAPRCAASGAAVRR